MRYEKLQEYYNSKEYMDRLMARAKTVQQCMQDPLFANDMIVNKWRLDPIAFIETWGWIINPKYNNEVKPFFLFEYQKKVIEHIHSRYLEGTENEILIDKPREMGLTWVLVWYQLWHWLFTENWSGFNLSRTETEVDDGTADPSSSLFGKYRWSIAKLPAFLTPSGYTPKGKKGNSTDMALRIANPDARTSLVGSTSNENAGRSRRYSFTFVDECFFIDHFMIVRRALTSVSSLRVYVSTSKASQSNKKFVNLCKERGNYISLTYDENPFKDAEWFKQKEREAEVDPEVMKEVSVSYNVSTAMQYYPEITQSKQDSNVLYDPKRPIFVSLDYGRQDHTVIIWWQFNGLSFIVLECLAKNKVDFDWFTPFMNPELIYDENKYQGYFGELLKKVRTWKKPIAYFGEPAHKQVHYPSNTSIQKELSKYGIRLTVNDNAVAYEVRRKAGSLLLPKMIFNMDSEGVMELYDCIQNSKYAGSAKSVSKESSMKPAHDDEVGDFRSAFENGAVNIPRVLRLQRGDIDSSLIKPQGEDGSFTRKLLGYLNK